MGSKLGALVATVAVMLGCAPAALGRTHFRPRIGHAMGLIPTHAQAEIALGTSIPVVYHGGPVMHTVHVHTLFWAPPGFHFDGPVSAGGLSYRQLIERFFADVAHDSGSTSNVFSLGRQYPDSSGARNSAITYDPATDSLSDAAPFPGLGNRCPSPAGIAVCITDLQLQRELDRVIQARDPGGHGLHDLWFVLLPPNVDLCVAPGQCATSAFLGYHALSNQGHGETVYVAVPDPLVELTPPPGSDPEGNPEAESAIDTATHELAEAMTDPDGSGWMDPNGMEVGDKCEFGPQEGTPLGYAADGSPYNQVINGEQYLLQGMWSNVDQGCSQASSSTASALPLPRIDLRQYSPSVNGNTGIARPGVEVSVLLLRAQGVVAGGDTRTAANGSWSMTLRSIIDGSPQGVGDDRDTIVVDYGAHGPPQEFIQTGDGGNPFTQAGWTGWFALDNGYAVGPNSVSVAPCSQVGVLTVRVGGRATAPPISECGTEDDVATVPTGRIGAGTASYLSSLDNRAVTLSSPNGALVDLTIPLGEPDSVSLLGNAQVLLNPTGVPSCTAHLRQQRVTCSGLVPGAPYALTRSRGNVTRRDRADLDGIASFAGFGPGRAIAGGDRLTLRNGAWRALTTLHVAHLRVDIRDTQTVVAGGSCEPGLYYGPALSSPPTGSGIGSQGVTGDGTLCSPSGSAAGLPTGTISQTDDLSGGQTTTEVPEFLGTAPVQDATLYGPFIALAQTGVPGPNHSVIPGRTRVSLRISRGGSRRIVLRSGNVDTPRGVAVRGLAAGAYVATWVLIDVNGDTRTMQTQFVQERLTEAVRRDRARLARQVLRP